MATITVNDAFLAGLPEPGVIEEIDFEAVLGAMKTDLAARFPAISPILALESSAAVKVLEAAAYRETVMRARINDAARANLLAYATGTDLDHLGANASPPVARVFGETDARYRARILLTTMARNAGSIYRYRLVALNADPLVRDAIAYRLGKSPVVNIAILSYEAGGAASAGVLANVRAAFMLPENRLVNGVVVVGSAIAAIIDIAATLTLTPETPASVLPGLVVALNAAWATEGGLGRDLTLDWIKARLMARGVYAVAVTLPAATVVVPPYQAVSIGAVSLTAAPDTNV